MTALPLHVVSENASTVVLGWDPPPACRGYVFTRPGARSSTLDPTRSSVRFAKPGPYTVEALGTLAAGVWPPPAAIVPAPPALTNPVTFTCKSGVANFFDTAGRHAIIKPPSSGLVEQGPKNDNAIITLKNCPAAIVEGVGTYAENRQSAGVGNGYGYGLYLVNCGVVYLDEFDANGPGLAQGVVMSGAAKVQIVRSQLNPMHPVWHLAKGKPVEVHTDAIQSYGGPGILEVYDTVIRTCGSITQVQPYKGSQSPMGMWRFRRCDFGQVSNPDSDEMPQAMTKDPGAGAKWPSEFIDCTLRPLGLPFSVSWVSDEQAWQPAGTWGNTGDRWTVVA